MFAKEIVTLLEKLCSADERRRELLKYSRVPPELIMTEIYQPDYFYFMGFGLAERN